MKALVVSNIGILCIWMLVAASAVAEGQTIEPKIENGNWTISFRYWSERPLWDDVGGYILLVKVKSLGIYDPQQPKQSEYQTGVLSVKEVLSSPRQNKLLGLKTLTLGGCHGLSVADWVIVFVDAEPYQGGFVVNNHVQTTSKLGVNIGKKKEGEDYEERHAKRFIELLKSRVDDLWKLSTDDLRVWAHFDPNGALEQLLRYHEMKSDDP